MKTAIIVLNYNDSKNTINFVNSILNYDVLDKIIVVDNLSTKENELEKIKKLECGKVDVINSDKNGGYAYGNNFGLRYLDKKYQNEFKYVIISNPDVSVEEKSIATVINKMEQDKKIALASPRMFFISGPARRAAWKKRTFLIDVANSTRLMQLILFPLFKKGEYSKKEYSNDVLNVQNIAGSFFIANHEIFKSIDYFDENTFLFYEEDIISEKLKEKGYKILLFNNIHFMHYESKSIGKVMNLFKKIDILFDSRIYFHKTYNHVGIIGQALFQFLRICRKIELLIEIPFRKLINKKKV